MLLIDRILLNGYGLSSSFPPQTLLIGPYKRNTLGMMMMILTNVDTRFNFDLTRN